MTAGARAQDVNFSPENKALKELSEVRISRLAVRAEARLLQHPVSAQAVPLTPQGAHAPCAGLGPAAACPPQRPVAHPRPPGGASAQPRPCCRQAFGGAPTPRAPATTAPGGGAGAGPAQGQAGGGRRGPARSCPARRGPARRGPARPAAHLRACPPPCRALGGAAPLPAPRPPPSARAAAAAATAAV